MYAKILQGLLQRFFLTQGRAPLTPKEWSKLRARAMELARKEGGDPITGRPFPGWKPKVIEGGKGIESLIKSGDVKKGVAPKTTKEILKTKKDRGILLRDADEDIARIKRENKQAVEDFKKKHGTKTVEDFRDEGDWDPSGMASGGIARVALGGGKLVFEGLKKFLQNKKTIRKAVDDIFPTGDYKYDAEMAAEALVENNPKFFKNKLIDDLSDVERSDVYGAVLLEVQSDFAKMLQMKRLSKPKKTLEGIKKKGTIDISDPEVSDEFSRFMKESDPKGYKDLEQKIEIADFDVTGRKKQASGGRVPLMYGGDPGFQFEYGGSWADWRDKHQHQMPVTDYIKTKLPKERLPFRDPMIFGGSAGLKGMWKQMLKNLSKGKDKPVKRLFPKLSARDREMEKLVMGTPEQKAFREGEVTHKIEGIDILINRLKHDKKIIERQAKNKAMKDEGLDFLMKDLEKSFSDVYTPNLGKYTDIDKDILQLENIKKNLLTKDRKLHQSGGLAYMLGEPTYMKYEGGGSVGHAPWHKPSGQPQPQGQDQSPTPQVGGAQTPGRGQPNPMKGPQGLPSVAPRTMDPQYMQQQMMQKAMMGQGQGQPRMGMEEGGFTQDDFNRFLKEREEGHREGGKYGLKEDWERYKRFKQYGPGSIQEAAEGGRIGLKHGSHLKVWGKTVDEQWPNLNEDQKQYIRENFPDAIHEKSEGGRIGLGLGSMSRRAFLKMMAAITGTGAAAGTGLLKLGKAAKVVPKVTEEVIARGADGSPTYIWDLIDVVKAKGTRDIVEGFKKSDYSTVHSYKGVDVIEDAAGNTRIKKPTEGVATDASTGKMHEGTSQETHMEITKGEYVKNKQGKMVKAGDEYTEGTVRPDMDGKMKDFEEGIDDLDHLELKEIADEIDTLIIKKASGGLAHMLGE